MVEVDLLAKRLKSRLHQIGRCLPIAVVEGDFKQFPVQESSFNGICCGAGNQGFLRGDRHDPNRRLVAGKGNRHIERVFGCQDDQFLRGISPAQTERRFEKRLRHRVPQASSEEQQEDAQSAKVLGHARILESRRFLRKPGTRRSGFVLVEAMMSLSLLTFLGIILLKLSLNILHPRQWILQQTVTDAYMSYERAYAERVPFDVLLSDDSPWPAFPETQTTVVEVGRLPGASSITGTVTRTRIADPANYPVDGGTGTEETNPAAMKVWRAQSVLTYQVGNRTYARSRTVLRSQ